MSDRVFSYQFRGNFANLTAGLATSSKAVQGFGNELTALDRKGQRMRSGLTDIGNTAGKIGVAAGFAVGGFIAVTAKFESAMSRVSAATNASAEDLDALRNAAIKAGADTVFSASEAADGITELAKAGLTARDILGGGLSGALDLAAAGQIGVADAAATTAITLQQFSLDGSQATRVADTLAAAADAAVGDVGDMAQALKYVGPVAAQMGISLEETTGAIAELASSGILADQAGTSLRGMLTSLTSPSKVTANTMAALGINVYDAQSKFIGFDGVAGELHRTLSGLTDAQRDEALGRIFGNEQITAARILYAGGAEAAQDWADKVTDSGHAADRAGKLTNNLAGDVEQLKGSFETAFIETGTSSQGPLRELTQSLTDVVNGYSALPGPAQSAAGATLALTAAIGGTGFVASRGITGLANLKGSLMDLGVTTERAATATKVLGRSAAGAAGLGVFAAGLATTNKAVASLETTAGAAAVGFSVGGPWGAAIGGAIGLVVGLGKSHDDTADKVAALTGTFDVQTGAITDNTQAMIAKQLQDEGVLDSAERLGISTQLVTDAVLGQAGAQEQLNAALDGIRDPALAATVYEQAAGFTAAEIAAIDTARAAEGLHDTIPGLADTFAASAAKAQQLAQAMNGTIDPTTVAGTAAYQTAEQFEAAAKALQESKKAARTTAEGFFNLGDSLDDSKVSLDQWITNLQNQAQALRDFQKNAETAANRGLRGGLIKALEEAGPAGALRMQQLADGTDTQIKRVNHAFGSGQDAIKSFVDAVAGVKSPPPVNVTANVTAALDALRRVDGYVIQPKSFTVTKFTNATVAAAKPVKRAGGGPVWGAGTATSDSIPAMLSNGEYVVNAKAVDHYGVAMFDGLNSRAAYALASGGTAQRRGRRRRALVLT